MDNLWENQLATLLGDLSSVQEELLALLSEKRKHLRASDTAALRAMTPREQALTERLQACHERRGQLLKQAAAEGLPSTNLSELAGSVKMSPRSDVQKRLKLAAQQSRLLQHNSLGQWVAVQRTLLHLSQMIEIIATGGQQRPTYGKEDLTGTSGTLVDHAA